MKNLQLKLNLLMNQMNKTNIKDLEAIRDYLDKLIDNADEYIAELDEEIA